MFNNDEKTENTTDEDSAGIIVQRIPFFRRLFDKFFGIKRESWICPRCLGRLHGKGNASIFSITYFSICFDCGWSSDQHDSPWDCEQQVKRLHDKLS